MTGINTNITNRIPSRLHANEVEVFSINDFPAAVSNVITLVADTTYRIMDTIVTADRFVFPDTETVELVGGSLSAELEYTADGPGAFFTVANLATGRIIFTGLSLVVSGDDATVFDIASSSFNDGEFFLENMVFDFDGNPTGLGNFENVVCTWRTLEAMPPRLGSTLTGCRGTFNGVNFTGGTVITIDTDAQFNFVGDCKNLRFMNILLGLDTDKALFYFDPIMSGPAVLDDCQAFDPEERFLFAPGATGNPFTVTAFEDASDEVRVNTFPETHGYTTGDTVLIANSVLYHGGYTITVVNSMEFDLDGSTFTIDDSMVNTTVDSGSLTETDSRVMVSNSPGFKPSQTICGVWAEENTTATTINTQNVFENLNLDTAAAASTHMERFILESTTTGEVIYIGAEPKTLCVSCELAGQMAAGGAINISFQLLQNGNALPTPDNVIYITRWITTDPLQTTCKWFVTAEPDDTFIVQVTNTEGTNNVVIHQFSLTMQ